MNKLRTNQGGSIASFIIIGVIIISFLAGVIYFVNNRSEQVRKDEQIASEEKESKEEKKEKIDSTANTNDVNIPSDADDEILDLPATGPELFVSELVGLFSLSTFSLAYLSSRKKQ